MANQEDRELELALALSAKEERERQEKVRGPAFAGPAHLLWTLPSRLCKIPSPSFVEFRVPVPIRTSGWCHFAYSTLRSSAAPIRASRDSTALAVIRSTFKS